MEQTKQFFLCNPNIACTLPAAWAVNTSSSRPTAADTFPSLWWFSKYPQFSFLRQSGLALVLWIPAFPLNVNCNLVNEFHRPMEGYTLAWHTVDTRQSSALLKRLPGFDSKNVHGLTKSCFKEPDASALRMTLFYSANKTKHKIL